VAPDAPEFAAHRLVVGRGVAVLLAVLSVLGVLDVLRLGQLGSQGAAVCLLLAVPAAAYVLGMRPGVLEGPAAIEVRNPMRTTVVPWDALTDVDVADVLRLRVGDREVRCFAVPRRRPSMTGVRSAMSTGFMLPAKDPGRGWEPEAGQPRAQALAQRLRDLAAEHRRLGSGPGQPRAAAAEVTTRWARDAVVAVALVAVLVLAALVLR
jgi:Bacterial PH domain